MDIHSSTKEYTHKSSRKKTKKKKTDEVQSTITKGFYKLQLVYYFGVNFLALRFLLLQFYLASLCLHELL